MQVLGALLELSDISLVFGFILPKLIDIFDRLDPVVFLRGLGEIAIVELTAINGLVQRPLS